MYQAVFMNSIPPITTADKEARSAAKWLDCREQLRVFGAEELLEGCRLFLRFIGTAHRNEPQWPPGGWDSRIC